MLARLATTATTSGVRVSCRPRNKSSGPSATPGWFILRSQTVSSS